MDKKCFDEIVIILNKEKREDLVAMLSEFVAVDDKVVDQDYKPTKLEVKRSKKKEYYSDSEGSAEEETLTYSVDQSGFYQLEFSDEET